MFKEPSFRIEPKDLSPERETAKRRLCDLIENRIEGINVERVESFITEHDMSTTDYRLYNSSDEASIKKILRSENQSLAKDAKGQYMIDYDMILVPRGELEELNGPEYTEGFLVHEMVHGSTDQTVFAKQNYVQMKPDAVGSLEIFRIPQRKIGLQRIRCGMLQTHDDSVYSGAFFEEGACEMMRAKYMRQNMSSQTRKGLADILGVKSQDIGKATVKTSNIRGTLDNIPTELLHLVTPMEVAMSISTLCAVGIGQLCDRIDGLEDAIYQARNDPYKLREIPKMVNAVDKDLYAYLMRLEYNQDDFMDGSLKIQQLLSKLG